MGVFLPRNKVSAFELKKGVQQTVYSNFEFFQMGESIVVSIESESKLLVEPVMVRHLVNLGVGMTVSAEHRQIATHTPSAMSDGSLLFDHQLAVGHYCAIAEKHAPKYFIIGEPTDRIPVEDKLVGLFNESIVNGELKVIEVDPPAIAITPQHLEPGMSMLGFNCPADYDKLYLHSLVFNLTAENDTPIKIIYDLKNNKDINDGAPSG
jgi:hypothetical protein